MNELVLRRMTAEDIPSVSALEREIFSMPWSEQGFLDALTQPAALFFVAEHEGKIAGYCGMYCVLDEGEITNVAVAPRVRRKQIGRRMMNYLLAAAGEAGITNVLLEVRVSNAPAIHLYESLGFVILGLRKNFYEAPREDGYVMQLRQ